MKKIFFVIFLVIAMLTAGSYFFGSPSVEDESPLPAEKNVSLYYYNPDNDKDDSGNIMCGRDGLASVARNIPATATPIQDTINLLIRGNLAESERKAGIGTEFPLPGFKLEGANLSGGILTLEFDDPENKTSGGSCRAGILRLQIEATARQFPGVEEVRFKPETLFQP